MPEKQGARSPGLAVDGDRILGVCGDDGLIDIRLLLESGRSIDAATLARWLHSSGTSS